MAPKLDGKMAWFGMPPLPDASNGYLAGHVAVLRSSFRRLGLGELIDPALDDVEAARRLFEAPFALLSHDTSVDPVFNYGNRKALEWFRMDWEGFTRLPSRLSAEPVNRMERERLLQAVRDQGFISDYRGVRIAADGSRFLIDQAIVWNLVGASGEYCGQAATFAQIRPLDGEP